jgi:GTP-binding protein EngB required for normal cell division
MSGRRRSAPDLAGKAKALQAALEAGGDRLDPVAREAAQKTLARTAERLRLGGERTVVALVGATGSGKSSLFNALSGMEIADVGARRPLTAEAMACVWGDDDAGPLLDWLGVPPARRVERETVLDADREAPLHGLVLLDLPDHDSTAVAHRLEVDRLVELVDLLVWVVDPQKYADESLHRGYLRRLGGHDEVMLVVLNQVDRLAAGEVETCRTDLRRLLDADGLSAVRIVTASARRGDGVEELRELIADVVQGQSAFVTRASADLDEAARRLAKGLSGKEPDVRTLPAAEDLVSAMASAAGLPVLLDNVASEYRRQASAAVSWPFLRAWRAMGTDPLRRLQFAGQTEERLRELTQASLAAPSPAQRERVDLAVGQVSTAVAERLPPRWARAVRSVTAPHVDDLAGELDKAVGEVDLQVRRPWWWLLLAGLQVVLAAAVVVGFVWLILLGLLRWLDQPRPPTPYVGSVALPTLLLLGGLVLGAALGLAGVWLVRQGAQRRRTQAVQDLRSAVVDVAWRNVVSPVEDVLADHRAAREALAGAF